MEGKSSDWMRVPSGPTVCRCCFAEGCYKDISTEYFWMGKREVYAEMLTETFDLSIAFAQASGPNSNSRLICEPCISRLRDASEFKRQVQECEKMFLQYLDPGRAGAQEIEMEIAPEPEKEVKLERVKLEKAASDDEFDDRGGFDDMDDDDLDDQPLTKLASKVPKKESVDLLDLLDNAKAEKRKSSSKSKASPAKKSKTKKESPKASASKVKPEKKKKGWKGEESLQTSKELSEAERWRANLRNNVSTIIITTTVYPFQYKRGQFLCFFCKKTFPEAENLRQHNRKQHYDVKQLPRPKSYDPMKIDIAEASCKLCSDQIKDYAMLKLHLTEHDKQLDMTLGETVHPFNLLGNEHICQLCGMAYESLQSLFKHMHEHSDRHICEKCGGRFMNSLQMANHIRMKECFTSSKNDSVERCNIVVDPLADERYDSERRRITIRNNVSTIIATTSVCPFRFVKGVYLCYYCKDTFPEPAMLRQHNGERHSEIKQLPKTYEPAKMDFVGASCKLCMMEIPDYPTLRAHLAEHGKELDMTHGDCIIPYNLNSTSEHVCQICGRKYETFVSLHRHINEHYDSYICDKCGKKFITSRQMVKHVLIHEEGIFPCKECDLTFTMLAPLTSHIAKVHKPRARNKCPICDERFAFYGQRLKHLRTVHNQKTPSFPCPSCDRVFNLSSKRSDHIRTQHLQEKKHDCKICGMKFFGKRGLEEHLVKHGGEKKYQCEVCQKSYARLKTLREHMRIHNNDRRFTCAACGQAFVQKCSMKHHIKVHHPTLLKDEIES